MEWTRSWLSVKPRAAADVGMQEAETVSLSSRSKHHANNRVDTAAFLLKQCSSSLPSLKQIHAHIFRFQLYQNNSLASILVSLYASHSLPLPALLVFSLVSRPSLSLFNHAIRAFSKSPRSLLLYLQMTRRRIPPNNFTFPFLLNSCAALASLPHGLELHSRLLKSGYAAYLPVSNALIDMYGKCGCVGRSRQVFDEMLERDVVSYNALLGAHARGGEDMGSARRVFDEMPVRNVISWNAMIVGYANCGDLEAARGVFEVMPLRNVVSWTTMIVGYAKCGLMDMARVLFEAMPVRNLVSWAVIINGYAQNGQPTEALSLFRRMEMEGMKPDAVTMTGVISASAQLGGTELANSISSYVDKNGIERNEKILTGLVDMQAKCGNMEEACSAFEEIPSPDVFSYSALITGLASHGYGFKALEIFSRMQTENIRPDHITFIGVLNACSHTGLIDNGLRFWKAMIEDYKIEPGPDHYACMVDMLGRAGRLTEAHELIESMPRGPHCGALGALLAACRTYDNVEIAESVAKQLFKLEPENTGNYLLLWSIYALRERWDDAARVRKAMNEKGINKLPGCSWIESNRSSNHYSLD